ncbi:MAG: hypothetical protein L6R42_005671, partial [Xanthoria sp. 1 TBL-2021]
LPAKGDAKNAHVAGDAAGDDAGDNDDYLALLADYPHNGQYDSDACPSFETCSENGNDYFSALHLTSLGPYHADKDDGKAIFLRDYKRELVPRT